VLIGGNELVGKIHILEILVAIFTIYLVPEGFIYVIKRVLRVDNQRIVKFIINNIEGYLFGLVVAVIINFTFGVSHEQMMADFVRKWSDRAMSYLGVDSVSVCIRRTKEIVNDDPDKFVEDAVRFNHSSAATLDKRGELLAIANRRLMFREGPRGRAELYEASVAESCKKR
jgi:hypothetical protein